MEVPTVTKMCGMFPVKYGTFVISIIALGVGGIGLAGVILYGLVENAIVESDIISVKADNPLKKAVLLLIGLSSLLLFISGILMLLGVVFNIRGAINISAWLIFGMCMIILLLAMGAPVTCFFVPDTCLIKQISTAMMVMGYLVIIFFLEVWLYFMVVVFNHLANSS